MKDQLIFVDIIRQASVTTPTKMYTVSQKKCHYFVLL